jgi:hypothetical protein
LGDGSLANRSIPGEVNGLTGTETTYAYDGDGLRTAKTTAQGNHRLHLGPLGRLPLLVGETTGTAATHYLYGPGDMPLARIDAAGEIVYYHGDKLGSTRALSDADGDVVGTATYDAYGNTTASSGIAQPFGFAGHRGGPPRDSARPGGLLVIAGGRQPDHDRAAEVRGRRVEPTQVGRCRVPSPRSPLKRAPPLGLVEGCPDQQGCPRTGGVQVRGERDGAFLVGGVRGLGRS